jgi:hypothetical protein
MSVNSADQSKCTEQPHMDPRAHQSRKPTYDSINSPAMDQRAHLLASCPKLRLVGAQSGLAESGGLAEPSQLHRLKPSMWHLLIGSQCRFKEAPTVFPAATPFQSRGWLELNLVRPNQVVWLNQGQLHRLKPSTWHLLIGSQRWFKEAPAVFSAAAPLDTYINMRGGAVRIKTHTQHNDLDKSQLKTSDRLNRCHQISTKRFK